MSILRLWLTCAVLLSAACTQSPSNSTPVDAALDLDCPYFADLAWRYYASLSVRDESNDKAVLGVVSVTDAMTGKPVEFHCDCGYNNCQGDMGYEDVPCPAWISNTYFDHLSVDVTAPRYLSNRIELDNSPLPTDGCHWERMFNGIVLLWTDPAFADAGQSQDM